MTQYKDTALPGIFTKLLERWFTDAELPEAFEQLLAMNHDDRKGAPIKVTSTNRKSKLPQVFGPNGEICDIVTKHYDPNDTTKLLYSECLVYDAVTNTWTTLIKPEVPPPTCTPVHVEEVEEVIEETKTVVDPWFSDRALPPQFKKIIAQIKG